MVPTLPPSPMRLTERAPTFPTGSTRSNCVAETGDQVSGVVPSRTAVSLSNPVPVTRTVLPGLAARGVTLVPIGGGGGGGGGGSGGGGGVNATRALAARRPSPAIVTTSYHAGV